MAQTPQVVSINKIYLDIENPRHNNLPDEPSIIRYLIADEGVRNLARDISEAGGTSPLEVLALIRHEKMKSAYTVVEGNRRVCALKLLADPDKAGSEKDRRYFATLSKGMAASISKVYAVVFESRAEATRWFALRHRGEQDGVGTKAWNARQIARFNIRTNGKDPNAQAALLIGYATEKRLLTPQELQALNISTLTRFLSNPVFRHALGLFDRNSIQITVPDHEFERALERFLKDSLNPETGVNSRTSVVQRKAYASKLALEKVAATSHSSTPHIPGNESTFPENTPSDSLKESGEQQPSAAEQKSQKSASENERDGQHPDRRRRVIPSSFSAKIKDKVLKRLYKELKDIDAVDFTVAATALFRSVLEKSSSLYLLSAGVTPEIKLDEKLKQLQKQLASEGMKDRELKFLRVIAMNGKDGDYAPDTLGHYIHGGAIPTPTYVFRYWDNMEPIFRHTLRSV